jgi:hypothetical protein
VTLPGLGDVAVAQDKLRSPTLSDDDGERTLLEFTLDVIAQEQSAAWQCVEATGGWVCSIEPCGNRDWALSATGHSRQQALIELVKRALAEGRA